MALNISTYIHYGFTMVAGATANVDVRMSDIADMRVFLNQTWASGTSSSTGIAMNLYPGWGTKDPAEIPNNPIPVVLSNPASAAVSTIPQFADNYAPVTTAAGYVAISQPPVSQGTSQSTKTMFYLNTPVLIWPDWIRMQVVNLDGGKPVTIQLLADI